MKVTDIPAFLRDGNDTKLVAWIVERYANTEIPDDDNPANELLKTRVLAAATQMKEFRTP